ncbi:sterile alpha motif-like domain-containing protein [Staphylococcus simiae]|uniref:sterile alpha motif-like domain-containing protein n=1 Tax=Staphylococcus simiae TaxID=308354 RepID=UPI001A975987|nr:sterile alpha motif-like domain-containing protein [Staphylococcus simiae]MBO1199539.1 sterile alpha motif-like domain-containing protein [Staphylococcus simiae]MBO1201792.1 sterile alpha motif-like domain-containing protein [Staphylococcus simiae]MBO1203896.1 sterile alpha motif-like domain-containing protein [Staphylococcus simiae]MBO1211556.1 sterile alpha motif-like domain-containing protein [Staphylococcus simiae]MBO1230095.1 sterile alpha motif-like domain-containing protein [Staphylo
MTFYEYILGFVNDKTPLGDLATWVKQDDKFPKQEKIAENILSYFHQMTNLDHSFLEIVKRSLSLYDEIK